MKKKRVRWADIEENAIHLHKKAGTQRNACFTNQIHEMNTFGYSMTIESIECGFNVKKRWFFYFSFQSVSLLDKLKKIGSG